MLNPDDLEPPRKSVKPMDLQTLSIEELKNYISSLQDEIARVEDMIGKKQSHRSGLDSLFNLPKSSSEIE